MAKQASFEGKTAIVTGGASGIGKALGAELVAQGAHVMLADIDGAAAERAAEEISRATTTAGSVTGAHLDVRDGPAVFGLVERVAGRHGRLDLMFNNAGIAIGGQTHTTPAEYWDRIIDVNIRGVVNGVLAAYPMMVAQGRGHIVNTASGAGLAPAPLTVAYTATKHAVVGLSTALRPEAAALGVRVSVLCPGMVETPILDKLAPDDLPPRADAFASLTGREFLAKVGLSPMAVEVFARRALRQVARNDAIIVLPWSAKALWYLNRCSPAVVDLVGRLLVRRVLADAPRPVPGS